MMRMEGTRQLSTILLQLKGPGCRNVMKKAVNYGLTPILAQAKSNAPGKTIKKMLAKRTNVGRRVGVVGQVYLKDIFYKGFENYGENTVMWKGQEMPFLFVAMVLEFGSSRQNIAARRYLRSARESRGPEAIQRVRSKASELFESGWKAGRFRA